MTAYEVGFMSKCAEAGLGAGEAMELMKVALAMPPWMARAFGKTKALGSRYWQLLRGGSDEVLGGYRAALKDQRAGISNIKASLKDARSAAGSVAKSESNLVNLRNAVANNPESRQLADMLEMAEGRHARLVGLEKGLENAKQGLRDIKSYAMGGNTVNPYFTPSFNQKAVSNELANVFAARAATGGAAAAGLMGLGSAVGGGRDPVGYDDYAYDDMGYGQYGNMPVYR